MNCEIAYTSDMAPWFLFRRQNDTPRPASEREVVDAANEVARKEKLVERFGFLPPEMKQVAKETALSRFLEILLSHMRR